MRLLLRTVLIAALFVLGACGGTGSQPDAEESPTESATQPYVGHGVIQEIRDGQLVIQHGEIPGLMGAMTMPYTVSPEIDIEGFTAGDDVRFEVEVPTPTEYVIVGLEEEEGENPQ